MSSPLKTWTIQKYFNGRVAQRHTYQTKETFLLWMSKHKNTDLNLNELYPPCSGDTGMTAQGFDPNGNLVADY